MNKRRNMTETRQQLLNEIVSRFGRTIDLKTMHPTWRRELSMLQEMGLITKKFRPTKAGIRQFLENAPQDEIRLFDDGHAAMRSNKFSGPD